MGDIFYICQRNILEVHRNEEALKEYAAQIEELSREINMIHDVVTAEWYKSIKMKLLRSEPRMNASQPEAFDYLTLIFSVDGVETSRSSA